jgi:general secretion pathway protein D
VGLVVNIRLVGLGAVLCIALAACSTGDAPAPASAVPDAPALTETPPPSAEPAPLDNANTGAKFEMFPGNGAFTQPVRRGSTTTVGEQGDITLNFVNTDIKDVVKAVLGDYLKLNYEIGSNVQGSVTIQTSQPLQRAQVLPALEQALRLNGMTVVESHGIYKVLPLADAPRVARIAQAGPRKGTADIGYGIDIVPVRYVGAVEMQKLLEPLAPTAGIVHADAARNVLIIEGTAEERQTLRDDIALFDAG